jgi:hypothetical protein
VGVVLTFIYGVFMSLLQNLLHHYLLHHQSTTTKYHILLSPSLSLPRTLAGVIPGKWEGGGMLFLPDIKNKSDKLYFQRVGGRHAAAVFGTWCRRLLHFCRSFLALSSKVVHASSSQGDHDVSFSSAYSDILY